MNNWFTDDLKGEELYDKFCGLPAEYQAEQYYKASAKRARKLAGVDLYKTDPIMRRYNEQSNFGKRGFDVNNNCYAWVTGSVTNGFNRLKLPGGEALCPQPGDSMGVPFLFLNGRPASVFKHMSMLRALCRVDALQPVRVGKGEPLPETPEHRLVGLVLYKEDNGEPGYHGVVRAPGAKYFSHKPGTKLPPSMLDAYGNLIEDPRRSVFGEHLTHWAFFTLPSEGASFAVNAAVRELAQGFVKPESAAQRDYAVIEALAEVAAQRSPRFAQKLLSHA